MSREEETPLLSDIEAVRDLIAMWYAVREWALTALREQLGVEDLGAALGMEERTGTIAGSEYRYRFHGSGVDITKEDNRGGIDLDFDQSEPNPWDLRQFMVKQINDGALTKKRYRHLLQERKLWEATARQALSREARAGDRCEPQDYARAFAEVSGVLDGDRAGVPNDRGVGKVLCFMLRDRSECDVEVTTDRFVIRYSWHPANHPYFPNLAAGVIAQLMRWADLQRIGETHVCRFGPGAVETEPYSCSFGKRWLWIERGEQAIRVAIRRENRGGSRMPEAIGFKAVYVERDEPLTCPHCGQGATRLRSLTDALVCPHCSRSFSDR